MSKQQSKQSTADLPPAKCKITDLFQWNMPETSDFVVKLVCQVDPGGSKVELQDRELSSPACDLYMCVVVNVGMNKL